MKVNRLFSVLATLVLIFLFSGTAKAQSFSIFPVTAQPTTVDLAQTTPYEFGVKFTSSSNGFVTGIRFYKGPNNTGTHVGHLWNSAGTLLATVTFAGETSSGWQQMNFSAPVAITANTVYVASYFSPTGDGSVDRFYFNSAVNSPPLQALQNAGVDNRGGSAFPINSYETSNYWVDIVFTKITQLQITTISIPTATLGQAFSFQLQASGGKAPYIWSVPSGCLQTGLSLSSSGLISGTPVVPGTNSCSFSVADSE